MAIPKRLSKITTVDRTIEIPLYGLADVINSSYRIQTDDGLEPYSMDLVEPTEYTPLRIMTGSGIKGINTVITPMNAQPVTKLRVSNMTQTLLTLVWNASINATSYDIFKNGEFLVNTSLTSCDVTGLIAETTYGFSVRAKNGIGDSNEVIINITTLGTVDISLVFNVDFRGMGGSVSNTIYDTVNNVPCTLQGVTHDGSNGWLDNDGLKLLGNAYVTVPSNIGALHDSLNFNSGLTFEFVAYNPQGVLFRTHPNNLRAYVKNITLVNAKYVSSIDGTIKNGAGNSKSWFLDPVGEQSHRNPIDSYNLSTELNIITVRFQNNGICDLFINGWKGELSSIPTDFGSFDDMLSASPLYIRRDEVAINNGQPTTLSSFSIFNRALTDEEVNQRYVDIKTGEPLKSVSAYPAKLDIKAGETQRVTVIAVPSRYTSLLNNEFQSGNYGYAGVDQSGLVTGTQQGDTEISIASSYEAQSFTKYIPVSVGTTIIEPPVSTRTVNGISLNRVTQTLEVGESFPAMATTLPFDVFNDNIVIWESSNPSVCTVNFGVLKGISEGTTIITAYDGTKTYSTSFGVTIEAVQVVEILLNQIYNVPLVTYGIKNDNTNSIPTTNGIQAAMDYASANGYKKIVFPLGTYLITPDARSILPPTEMVIDFSNSEIHIAPNLLSPEGYEMFKLQNISNTKIINANIYGERDSVVTVTDAAESCVTVSFHNAYKSGFENCVISKSPGFNIIGTNAKGFDQAGRHPSKDNWQAGNIDPATGLNDDSVTSYHFRSISYLNASLLGSNYSLGYSQGYFGYPYLRSRLYSIYWYDQTHNFIEADTYNLQHYIYDKPTNAYYAKLVIYQDVAPTSQDGDFSAVAMLRSWNMPTKCFLKDCVIEDNNSCGLALTGGRSWIIEGNTFSRNGKRMPACDIDWEDGWDLSVGDVCRNNTFNSKSGVIFSGNHSVALYDNTFNQSNLHVWNRASGYRIYNNFFNGKGANRNLTLDTGSESYFSRNILKGVTYTKGIAHPGASYRVRDLNNTLI